jgi:hypothetical protein
MISLNINVYEDSIRCSFQLKGYTDSRSLQTKCQQFVFLFFREIHSKMYVEI